MASAVGDKRGREPLVQSDKDVREPFDQKARVDTHMSPSEIEKIKLGHRLFAPVGRFDPSTQTHTDTKRHMSIKVSDLFSF